MYSLESYKICTIPLHEKQVGSLSRVTYCNIIDYNITDSSYMIVVLIFVACQPLQKRNKIKNLGMILARIFARICDDTWREFVKDDMDELGSPSEWAVFRDMCGGLILGKTYTLAERGRNERLKNKLDGHIQRGFTSDVKVIHQGHVIHFNIF